MVRLSLLAALCCAAANAGDSYVFGPLERIAPDRSSVTVLGQTYAVGNSRAQLDALFLGQSVFISGELLADGQLVAHSIEAEDSQYVAGASEVFLSGRI